MLIIVPTFNNKLSSSQIAIHPSPQFAFKASLEPPDFLVIKHCVCVGSWVSGTGNKRTLL